MEGSTDSLRQLHRRFAARVMGSRLPTSFPLSSYRPLSRGSVLTKFEHL